jgi:hypothetical protein
MITIISGGQTGADLGALYGAKESGIPTGGTAPPRWISGSSPQKVLLQSFGLVEGEPDVKTYPKRSMKNVDDADGTIAIVWGNGSGTMNTIGYAQRKRWSWGDLKLLGTSYKPILIIQSRDVMSESKRVVGFILSNNIKILNVCGHQEKSFPGIEQFTKSLVKLALSLINRNAE